MVQLLDKDEPAVGASARSLPSPPVAAKRPVRLGAWDTNADGRDDSWDIDGDGKPDVFDANADGKPDQDTASRQLN